MAAEVDTEMLRQKCWDEALQTFGTAYIFEDRARRLRPWLRVQNLLGIGVPALVGGILLTFGDEGWYVQVIFVVGGILLLAELVLSVVAVVMNWEERLYYALDSATANYHLSDELRKLARDPPSSPDKFRCEVEKLQAASQERQRLDYRQYVSDANKRKGMRAALREFERDCSGCGEVPSSMEPTECNVCGQFTMRRTPWIRRR